VTDFRVYLVTDSRLVRSGSLEDAVGAACRAGIRAVQLREKDLDARSLHDLARRLRAVTSAHGAALFVNDRVDIAIASGADGVHCPEIGFPPALARRVAHGRLVVGASTHSLARALDAEQEGADFITFGPVFDTPSKSGYGPPQGLERLRRVAGAVRIPVLAIGGISPPRATRCLEYGASGVAVVSAILSSTDIAETVKEFETALGSL
jgi:thiamine-phosphate pyrophosphorylase